MLVTDSEPLPAASGPLPADRPERAARVSRKRRSRIRVRNRDLKWGIWVYFLLLIFEGALRKWFLPGLATPLLIVRDPIALWLVGVAFSRGLLPLNRYVIGMALIGILGSATAVAFGHGSSPVAVYGARILLLHFPLVFVIGRVFNRADVLKMGKVTLGIAIPMGVLIFLQFYSPQSAWVNRGVGGDVEGAGFSGAMGYMRPPGTFSFTNGTTLFFGLTCSYILYFWMHPQAIRKWVLVGSTGALLAAIPLSISRGLFFQVALTAGFALAAVSRKPGYLGKMLLASAGLAVTLAVLSVTPAFRTASEVMGARFESASKSEGGLEGTLVDRFLGGLVNAVYGAGDQEFFGKGLGLGTNVGAMFASGKREFLVAEGEWGRTIGELGPLLGLAVVFLRVGLAWKVARRAYARLAAGDLLPWMLLGFGLLVIAQGGWAQPTALGFFVIIGGLLVASLKSKPGRSQRPIAG